MRAKKSRKPFFGLRVMRVLNNRKAICTANPAWQPVLAQKKTATKGGKKAACNPKTGCRLLVKAGRLS